MLVDADHAPLEDAEEAFDGVGVDLASDVFTLGVDDDLMRGGVGRENLMPVAPSVMTWLPLARCRYISAPALVPSMERVRLSPFRSTRDMIRW